MKAFFEELFEYNHHCNRQLADVFTSCPDKTSEKATKLCSHILNAHHVWNSRMAGERQTVSPWDTHLPQAYAAMDKKNYENSLLIIGKLNLNSSIHYANTKGQSFNNNVRDILFHIINHSTYHRGQIAMEFRLSGLEPLVTDYIFYKR